MSREIEFRGKRCADGVWVYGDYVAGDSCDVSFIFPCDITSLFCVGGRYEVYENTIGQFTGFSDKKNNKIYEGDIIFVEFADKSGGCTLVGWNEKTASWGIMDAYSYQSLQEGYDFAEFKNYVLLAFLEKAIVFEVVGNVYDNPELLSTK